MTANPGPEIPAEPSDPTRELPPVTEPETGPAAPPDEAPQIDPQSAPGEWRPYDGRAG